MYTIAMLTIVNTNPLPSIKNLVMPQGGLRCDSYDEPQPECLHHRVEKIGTTTTLCSPSHPS